MPTQYADPYAERIAAQRALLAQVPSPRFSQGEADQRRAENERLLQLGLLGQLSGDETLAGIGAQVFRQAQQERAPRVSDQGVFDPMSGQFTLHPEVMHERQRQELARLEDRSAEGQRAWEAARQAAQERREQADERNALMARLAAQSGPLVQVLGPTGEVTYAPRAEAVGRQAPGNAPTEDERKAAGWLNQARMAYANMQSAVRGDPNAALPTAREVAVGALPGVGPAAAYAGSSAARQKFMTAASSFSEAVLRAATGAGVNREEALQKVQELTPRFGEHPDVATMKEQMARMYLESLQARAGRAAVLPRALEAQQQRGAAQRPGVVKFSDLPQ
jgi:hypothetical protein